jgi:hypothetical protein
MDKVSGYQVVMALSPAQLTNEVNALINDGWVPTGGIAIVSTDIVREVEGHVGKQSFAYQAMVKPYAE